MCQALCPVSPRGLRVPLGSSQGRRTTLLPHPGPDPFSPAQKPCREIFPVVSFPRCTPDGSREEHVFANSTFKRDELPGN